MVTREDTTLKKIEDLFDIRINNTKLVSESLVHPSVGGKSFQRLEFLGDRTLGLVMSLWLFGKYPEDSEGPLTKRLSNMVNRHSLLEIAQNIDLEQWIVFDSRSPDKERIVSDALESLIGALFIDQDMEIISRIIRTLWSPLIKKYTQPSVDPKSSLQENLQSQGFSLPTYTLLEQSGKSHDPSFKVLVEIDSPQKKSFEGEGSSKKGAEQDAAKKALASLEKSHTK